MLNRRRGNGCAGAPRVADRDGMNLDVQEAVEIVRTGGETAVLLTCEHASERLPEPWHWPDADQWLRGTHWAYDIGAAEITRELCAAWGATAVLSRFSRLLVDPNRETSAPDLVLERAEGRTVELNRGVDAKERQRRIERLWRPYHEAVECELARADARVVLAIHTFTPIWHGMPRDLEVGVLFDLEEELAERARAELRRAGFETRMNEPYSGKAGLIFSAHHHATRRGNGVCALELEVRQDLAADAAARARLIAPLRAALSARASGSLP